MPLTLTAAVRAVATECEAGETVADAIAFVAEENGLNPELLARKVRESYGENPGNARAGIVQGGVVENEAVKADREEREARKAEAERQERVRVAREREAARRAAMTPAQVQAEWERDRAEALRINQLLSDWIARGGLRAR